MVSNTRDRNIDSSRREDSRKGQVDRCEVINVRPHVRPYPEDKDFNTVDVQLIDRPRVNEAALTIEYVKLNSLQREHGKFQGIPWNARIGDMIYVYWLAEREALVLGTCTSVEQEPVCRSQADDQQQEYVFKLCPWEEPQKNADGNYIIFPNPKHPLCFKWWPKTLDSQLIFDCLEGHNKATCCSAAPCNSLDDHQSSTCFKNFSYKSPTTVDKAYRFKFLHHCGSYWFFDDDGVWRFCGKNQNGELGFIHHYADGKIEINSPVEVLIKAPKITLDGPVEITESLKVPVCVHQSCSCSDSATTHVDLDTGRVMKQEGNNQVPVGSQTAAKIACCNGGKMACCTAGNDLYELIDGGWEFCRAGCSDVCYSPDELLYIIDSATTKLMRREVNGTWTDLSGLCLSLAAASATVAYAIGTDEYLWKRDAGSWTNPEHSTAIIDISIANDGTVYAIRKADKALIKLVGSSYVLVSDTLALKEISARDAYHILGIGDADDIVYLWNDVRWTSQGVTAASIGISSAG